MDFLERRCLGGRVWVFEEVIMGFILERFGGMGCILKVLREVEGVWDLMKRTLKGMSWSFKLKKYYMKFSMGSERKLNRSIKSLSKLKPIWAIEFIE